MNSTRSIFVTLSKVFLLFAFIGFFLPFTQEALWGVFSGEETTTGLGFLLIGTKFSELYSLALCAVLCFASILYTVIILVCKNKNLDNESIALDWVFVFFAIYTFTVSFCLCQTHGYGIGIGAIFMLIGLALSFVFLACTSILKGNLIEYKGNDNTKAIFLVAPITVLLSCFFMVVCQIGKFALLSWITMWPGILAALWFFVFQIYSAKKGKRFSKNLYIVPLLLLNLLTSIGLGFAQHGRQFVKALTGVGIAFGMGKYYLFFLIVSEFILLTPILVDKRLKKESD